MAKEDVKTGTTGGTQGANTPAKRVSIKDKLLGLSLLVFEFVDITSKKDKDGNLIAVLQLAQPIPLVRGSQDVEINGKSYPVKATDVTEINVHERNFNEDFQFDAETNVGNYKGSNLVLDVAKNGGAVWLTEISFAQASQTYRTTARNARLSKMLGITDTTGPEKKVEPVA